MRVSLIRSAAFLLVACASSTSSGPQPIEVQSTGVPGEAAAASYHKMTATVLAVNVPGRTLTLKDEDGTTETINVPPEVKRLGEVAVGDRIVVEVQEGILFEYQPPGSAMVTPAAVVDGARAGKNQPPGMAAGAAVQSTVTITHIDLKSRIVEFQDPDGNKYHVKAGPKLSIEKLTVGDRMVATYAASVAINLQK